MKKIIAILLSLVMLLGCAVSLGEGSEKQTLGAVSINGAFTLKSKLPEGYKVIPFELSDDSMLIRIMSEDPGRPEMILSVAFDEAYFDVEKLNDMDDEALAILEETFTDTDPYVNISYEETAYGTRLLVARTTSESYDYLDFFTIYKGYCVEFVITPGEKAAKQVLTDEEVAESIEFLSELDFVEGVEEDEVRIAGNTFDANITGFDTDAKAIDVTLLTPITLTEWQAVSIYEGDAIRIGTEDVEIGTLRYEGDDAFINDEYELRKNEDGLYNVYHYSMPLEEEVKTLTLTVSDSLIFTDGIDPEFGDPLDENRTLTAEDLFTALAAAKENGVGFDVQNVRITFDENGEASQIERFYTPWQ